MKNESNEELARRAVDCRWWRWLAGMNTIRNGRVIGVALTGDPGRRLLLLATLDEKLHQRLTRECLPDLTDPATKGCVLDMLREGTDTPELVLTCERTGGKTRAWRCFHIMTSDHETEEACLVAALEAASKKAANELA